MKDVSNGPKECLIAIKPPRLRGGGGSTAQG